MNTESYERHADALVARIVALIPSQPQILTLDNPWALFKVPGFECADLQPTLFQASFALAKAKEIYGKAQPGLAVGQTTENPT